MSDIILQGYGGSGVSAESGYCTTQDFMDAQTGAQYTDLAPGVLQTYINRACAQIDQWCRRTFVPKSSVVETLLTGAMGRAVIDRSGFLFLYPIQAFPIVSVTSITWQVKLPYPINYNTTNQTNAVNAADILIQPDSFGDGTMIRVFEDFSALRGPNNYAVFTLTYNGGYATYPIWLSDAAILWTSGLLKRRGSESLVMTGTGSVVDVAALGGDIKEAKEKLAPHRRMR